VDETRDRKGWRINEVFVGHRIGSELLGGENARAPRPDARLLGRGRLSPRVAA
jgi:hypothetical protein